MDPQISFWIAAILAAFLLGLGKGGLAIVAALVVPVVSLVMPPILGAGLVLPLFILSDFYALWLFRGRFSAVNLRILIPGGILGVIAGFMLVSHVTDNLAKLIVASIGLWYLMQRLATRLGGAKPPPQSAHIGRGLFWGIFSGITSYISHSGGPPFQIYMLPQRLPKLVFAGTSTLFFAVLNLAKLPTFILAGQVSWGSFQKVVILIPIALIGARVGYWIVRIIPERIYYAMIELALVVVTAKLLWDVLV